MIPSSREGKQPLDANARIREDMHGLCKTCAFASDICAGFKKKGNGRYLPGLKKCEGYALVSNAKVTGAPFTEHGESNAD